MWCACVRVCVLLQEDGAEGNSLFRKRLLWIHFCIHSSRMQHPEYKDVTGKVKLTPEVIYRRFVKKKLNMKHDALTEFRQSIYNFPPLIVRIKSSVGGALLHPGEQVPCWSGWVLNPIKRHLMKWHEIVLKWKQQRASSEKSDHKRI